jgi:hypothetical protein
MRKPYHAFHVLGVLFLTMLVLPFVLFVAVVTAPAILFFAPFFALFAAEQKISHAVEDSRAAHGLPQHAAPAARHA